MSSDSITRDLRPGEPEEAPTRVEVSARALAGDAERPRYTPEGTLGEGGMGTVHLVRDHEVGRHIALKKLRDELRQNDTARARFEREARLQGQLEHPAIVPVYDVGIGPEGHPFFTMRRVRGQSLATVLRQMAKGEPARFSARKLLTAFAQLCAAVHYANERGVIHRDIKPANVMLGAYGEVYLIDWGVAKVLDEDEGAPRSEDSVDAPGHVHTAFGNIVGTLRTMSPEQASGEPVDARSDVYSLGAVLFELLTLKRLHPKGSYDVILPAIKKGVEARPSVRAPEAEVPPELEAICVAATRPDPKDRLQSALALHDAVEAYLDGDRDLQLRRESAQKHAEAARTAADKLLSSAGDEAGRANALREVGKALAFDPANKEALGTLVRLLTTPPRTVPREVVLEQEAYKQRRVRLAGMAAAMVYGYISLHSLLTWQLGVRDFGGFAMAHELWACALVGSVVTIWKRSYVPLFVTFLFGVAGCVFATAWFGPFLMVPTLLTLHVVLFALVQEWRLRIAILGIACVGWAASVFGHRIGLFAETARFVGGDLFIHSPVIDLPATSTPLYLFATTLVMLAAPAFVIGALRSTWHRSDEAMRLQAWQLRRLVSDDDKPLP